MIDPDYPEGIDYHWEVVLKALMAHYGLSNVEVTRITQNWLEAVVSEYDKNLEGS